MGLGFSRHANALTSEQRRYQLDQWSDTAYADTDALAAVTHILRLLIAENRELHRKLAHHEARYKHNITVGGKSRGDHKAAGISTG